MSTKAAFERGLAAHQIGDVVQAERFYDLVIASDRNHFDALHMLAILNAQRGNFENAARLFHDASKLRPDQASCHYNYGNVLVALGQYDRALACYDKALALTPTYVEAHFNRGNVLLRTGQPEDAVVSFDNALRLNGNVAEIHSSRGNALRDLGRFEEALLGFEKAVLLRPDNPEFRANRGNVLRELGRLEEALTDLVSALSIAPDNAGLLYNIGNILWEIGRTEEALTSFDKALAVNPNDAEVLQNRGNVLLLLGRYVEALADYERALSINPKLKYLEGVRLFAKMYLCDWANLEDECGRILARIRNGDSVSLPFPILAMESTAADQFKCAKGFSQDRYPAAPRTHKDDRLPGRIRVAYLSSDFRNHAVALLTAGLFENHDRSLFEIVGISFGQNDGSDERRRLIAAFDHFIDVAGKSDREAAKIISDIGIDVAVDLNGHTAGARTGILAMRPAPIQVNYLGYSGTMGAPYIDYILADKVVIPAHHRQYFSENIIYLPHSFMSTDSKRFIADRIETRSEEGLPQNGFIFCAFNNSYKITPTVFDVWMRLLRAVDKSVLWLSATNAKTMENLRREAVARNVVPERLVFAKRAARNEDHLARYRLADLYLDTLPYNAHTTASESLWVGLPVVTCTGATFASRVAASLLTNLGLTELVTNTLDEYEALALKLASDRTFLAAMKSKLIANKTTFPLFDTSRFTRYIEAAYREAFERHQRGEPPASFAVDA